MHYEGTIIRPPSEANSILLQVTTGCSHNKCSFCGAYKDKAYSVKKPDIISNDILFAKTHFFRNRRIFLCDGDALSVNQNRLASIFSEIRNNLPNVSRISLYANAKSIAHKSIQDLNELKKLGLHTVYTGLESGDDRTLANVNKGVSVSKTIEQCQKVKETGIRLSLTVILGLAGRDKDFNHAQLTGEALSKIDPDHIGILSLMLIPGTLLYRQWKKREFCLPDSAELLEEMKVLIQNTDVSRCLLHANHASNYLPLEVKMPKDKEKAVLLIEKAIYGQVALRDEWSRGL